MMEPLNQKVINSIVLNTFKLREMYYQYSHNSKVFELHLLYQMNKIWIQYIFTPGDLFILTP